MRSATRPSIPPRRRASWLAASLVIVAATLTHLVSLSDEPRESPASPNGDAAVVRDEDLERLLQEADQLLERREWDLAVTLLQRVLDESRDIVTVVSQGGAVVPLASEAERRFAKLPPDGLLRYRLRVDGEARARLAKRDDSDRDDQRDGQLADVVRRYFFSAQGDDATWELACRALDAFDFVAADALLERLASRHPDPTMNRSAIWLRKSLAAAYLGDSASAIRALREADRHAAERHEAESQRVVREHIVKLLATPPRSLELLASGKGPPAFDLQSLDRRTRDSIGKSWKATAAIVAPSSSDSRARQGELAASSRFEGRESERMGVVLRLAHVDSVGRGYDDLLVREDAESSGRRWLEAGWTARPPITMDGTRVFATFDGRLCSIAYSAGEWRREWTANEGSPLALPAAWTMLAAQEVSLRDPPRRLLAEDARSWADGMRHAVTTSDDVVLSVESLAAAPSDMRFLTRRRWSWRARANELVARASETGKVLWRRRPAELLQDERTARERSRNDPQDTSLLGPPARGDARCFVPLLVGSTLHLAAIDPQTGAVAWSSRVAGEPRDGAWPWSTVAVTCAGRDVYVAAGIGLIAAFDQGTGAVRWMTRYRRSLTTRTALRSDMTSAQGQLPSSGAVPNAFPAGWDEDRMTTIGRWLVAVASDDDSLTAYDRRTGRPVWSTPRRLPGGTAATQLVGVNADHIVVSGVDVVRCYDLRTGKLRWQSAPGYLTGAASLLETCVVIPCLTPPQSTGVRPLGTTDLLGGQSPRVELQVLDVATGQSLHRRPVGSSDPVPLSVIVTANGLALAGQDRIISLAPSDDSPAPPSPDAVAPLARRRLVPTTAATLPSEPASSALATRDSPRPPRSRLIVSDLAQGRVLELDATGKVAWTFDGLRFPGPCCGWKDGRNWVLDHERNEIVELDGHGRAVAVLSGLPGRPASFFATPDGSTVLTFPDLGLVGQVRANGSWQQQARVIGRPVHAVQTGAGNLWVALWEDQRVVEVDPAGRIVGAVEFESRPRSLQPATGEEALVTLAELGQVFQVRMRPGESRAPPTLVRSGGKGMRSASRLRDGGWLVAEQTGVALFGPDGKPLWKREEDVVGGLAVIEP